MNTSCRGGGIVDVSTLSLYYWEVQNNDRIEGLSLLDAYLDDRLNLVTIQLGENASELSTFESDFVELIEYVKERCPIAQIVVVGDFWEYGGRDAMKKRAAETCGVSYVDLSEIKSNAAWYAGLGTVVYGDDGVEHVIEHDGVAAHPGDEAMKYIAEKIYGVISG